MRELDALQAHTLSRPFALVRAGQALDSAKRVVSAIRVYLISASNEGALRDAPGEIERMLAYDDGAAEQRAREVLVNASSFRDRAIAGGAKNFKRDPGELHFTRHDGAWFDFNVVVRERGAGAPVDLLAYNFELRFPAGRQPAWFRFDLNPPGHANEDHGVRCHLHPGTDDWSLPSVYLDPFEILDLFVYGMRTPRAPEKPRA